MVYRECAFSTYIAAPFCAAMLAEQGAEVIRIEPPAGAPVKSCLSGWRAGGRFIFR
nr:hypothetical protein G6P99_38480 [Bradyrhizobium sp. 6(2017)]